MPPTLSKNILVLGAGELATFVLQALQGHPKGPTAAVSVLVRPATLSANPPRLQQLQSAGLALVAGDLVGASPDELAELFRPYDTVLTCMGYATPGLQLQVKITHAVLAAGVKRHIPFQYGLAYDEIGSGSSQPVFDEQLAVRALLRGQQATEWVIVQTGVFMTFLFEPFWGVLDQGGGQVTVRALGSWETGITATHPRDIGTAVARLLFDEQPVAYSARLGDWERYKGSCVDLVGETTTYGGVADAVERVAGKVTREEWGLDRLEAELARDPEDGLKRYRAVFAAGVGTALKAETAYNRVKGFGVTSLEDHLRQILS